MPGGKLSLDLAHPMDEAGAVHFLKFTDTEDLGPDLVADACELFRRRAKDRKESTRVFRAGQGRLARVGYFSASSTPFTRSRSWPAEGCGGSAAAASVAYERIMAEEDDTLPRACASPGRLDRPAVLAVLPVQRLEERVLQTNDHEADWEKVMVYLSESESGRLRPEWVAYAAHNYTGQPPSPLGRRRSR